jgi:aminoglycoside phosphotransferase (APT) family kinase protein
MLSDAEILAAAQRRSGAASLRLVRRVPFARPAGGSGAGFEHVSFEQDGALREAVLKQIAPDPQGPTLERRFYEELAPGLPLRVPALYASGPLPGRSDGWVLLEPLPERAPSRVTPARLLALAADLARAHAALLGRAPEWLPRPFGRDARARLAHVEEGAARLRERMRRTPALRVLASEAALEAAVRLARDPAPLVRACAGAETLIHRDLHHHNVSLGDPGGAIVFDWESVSAGPPLFDLALLHVYHRNQALALPGLGTRLYTWRRPALPWRRLLDHYLACFARAAPGADLAAVERAVPAAFAWEAVHRIGWVDELLGGLTPGAPWLARLPLAGWVEGQRTGPVMLRLWRALFAALPAHAAALEGA